MEMREERRGEVCGEGGREGRGGVGGGVSEEWRAENIEGGRE